MDQIKKPIVEFYGDKLRHVKLNPQTSSPDVSKAFI